MDDIKKPVNENTNGNSETPLENKPSHTFNNSDDKYESDYHTNARNDMKPPVRLDATPVATKKSGFDGPTTVVLQWLTYAFWGATIIAMSILTIAVLTFYVTGISIGDSVLFNINIGDSMLYGIAAVLVLLPISLICDVLYLKNEPEAKSRSSLAVMIVHAVVFALFGVGSLITVAFSVVSLIVSSSGHDSVMVTLYSSLIITFLFAVLFLRTVLPKKYSKIRYFFMALMVISIGIVSAYAVFGPINDAQLTRNDKLIEANLSTVSQAVNSYATSNKALPTSLDSLKLTGDAKKLVTDKLVTYKKDSTPSSLYYTSSGYFYYQLCVTYKKASTDQFATPDYLAGSTSSSSSSSSSSLSISSGNNYSYYVYTTPHPAGEKCYKLMTYNYDIVPMTSGTN